VVAILATPTTSVVELATPAEVFTTGPAHGRYEVRICAIEPGLVELALGFSVEAPHGLDDLADADTVIVPGGSDRPYDPPGSVTRALRAAADRGARIIASGSGTFVLAAAGLHDGRRATTHPDLADDPRHEFRQVYLRTSGPTAGEGIRTRTYDTSPLETFGELVRQDHAQATTDDAARVGDDLAEIFEWATARLDEPLSLTDMARAAQVSARTLARRFEAALGTTPMQWLLSQRIRRARHLLETTSEPVEQIARLTGFGSTSNFRLQFTKATGLSPRAYRRAAGGSDHPSLKVAPRRDLSIHVGGARSQEPRLASPPDPTECDLARSSGVSNHAKSPGAASSQQPVCTIRSPDRSPTQQAAIRAVPTGAGYGRGPRQTWPCGPNEGRVV
jgi:transcriptional regulator GlxA family with amidase domain